MKELAARLNSARALAPLALRLGVGITITWHGWQKIDGGVSNFAGFVDSLGIPAPTATAYAVTALEFGGGIMILAGLLTRLPALLLTIQMVLTAFWIKASELQTGFIGTEGTGYEIDVMLLVGSLAIVVLGPGLVSVDAAIGIESSEREGHARMLRARTAGGSTA